MHIVEEDQGRLHAGQVNIFTGRNYVLSVRSRTQRGFQDARARAEREPELLKHGAGYVLYALMDSVVDRCFPLLDKSEVELEAIEEKLFANASPRTNHRVAGMREYFRDVHDHLQRLNEIIEFERETVATATSVNLSMIQLQENATMKPSRRMQP